MRRAWQMFCAFLGHRWAKPHTYSTLVVCTRCKDVGFIIPEVAR